MLALFLPDSQMSGVLPPGLAAWTSLGVLAVSDTQVSGTLDPAFAAWSQLQGLLAQRTQLSGELPPAFGNWTALVYLELANTRVSGALPDGIAAWADLLLFDISHSRISGTLSDSLGAWTAVNQVQLAGAPISGTLSAAFAAWKKITSFRADGLLISGSIPEALQAWTLLVELNLANTRISGPLPQVALCNWTTLVSLDVSRTGLQGQIPFCSFWANASASSLRRADFSRCQFSNIDAALSISWAIVSVADNAVSWMSVPTHGALTRALDLSGNHVSSFLDELLNDLVRSGNVLSRLVLERMGLSHKYDVQQLGTLPLLDYLSLSGNNITISQEGYVATQPLLSTLRLRDNKLVSARLSSLQTPSLDLSGTSALFCYEDGFDYERLESLSLRGVRSAPTCEHAVERTVGTTNFSACGPPQPVLTDMPLASVFCITAGSRILFDASSLTCPAWSTVATFGQATLDVDAAFLGFWGCTCPLDTYWGYPLAEAGAALAAERAVMTADAWLGANETALSARTCLPCPAGVACSQLAVVDALHELVGSVYPLLSLSRAAAAGPTAAPRRSMLVYAAQLLPCLHPAVCNAPPAVPTDPSHWSNWISLINAGGLSDPAIADFRCREGHDPASLMCSRCLRGFWSDGFLCRPCLAAYAVLVPLGIFVTAAVAVAYVVFRARRAAAVPGSSATSSTEGNVAAIAFWFLQVSAALQTSSQINSARSGHRASADDAASSSSLSWLDQLVSFRPWALECVSDNTWDFGLSTLCLLLLPWVCVAACTVMFAARPGMREQTVFAVPVLLDLVMLSSSLHPPAAALTSRVVNAPQLYLPVAQRCIEWFNRAALPPFAPVSAIAAPAACPPPG